MLVKLVPTSGYFSSVKRKKCRTSSGISLLSPNLDLRKTCTAAVAGPTLKSYSSKSDANKKSHQQILILNVVSG
jgi:hypothetical protein